MCSRYCAYVLTLSGYLISTWHSATRPATLDLADQPTWLGLSVKSFRTIDENHAEVEFIARFRVGGGRASRLHERSRFVREEGRWFYVDGEVASPH
ncbi:MAG: YchJ family metal-binding protein [Dokdonella sp.]